MAPEFPYFKYQEKEAEQRLTELQAFVSSLLEGLGEGVIVVDREFNIRSANKGYCQQVNADFDDVIGKPCYQISHHSDIPCSERGNGCDCAVQKCFQSGEHYRALHEHHDKAGRPMYIETNAYPLRDSSGTVTSAIEALYDVTDKVQLAKQLDEAKERYRRLYDNAPDMMHSVNADGIIIACNATEERALGFSPGELIGRPCEEIVVDEDRGKCAQKYDLLRTTGSFEGELTLLAKDGKRIPVQVSSRAIKDDLGNFLMSDSILRDITEKKQLEAQLLHAQKMEAVGLLAGGIAHDFNNILTAIIGYGNLALMERQNDSQANHYIEQILASTDRAAYLTQSLLAFSRKQIINPKSVRLGEILARMEKMLSRIIGEDVDLKVYTAPHESAVWADAVQMEQIVMNLATNARDAMPHGGLMMIEIEPVELTEEYVRTHAFAKPGRYMMLSVTDTGQGMDSSTQGKAFEPFFTTKEVGKGTGLGLSMVYGIVKQHNGYINVYSESGKGTTFKIYLPSIEGEPLPFEAKRSEEVVGGTETILLAEDEPQVRELTATILRAHGYTVIAAENGEDAVTKFKADPDAIAMVVLDVIMPKKNGKAAFDKMNKIRPGVKALFLSGYTSNLIHTKGILDEGREFISKPFMPSSFLSRIRGILDKPNPDKPEKH
jgi:PAS domain S-box-containing protein